MTGRRDFTSRTGIPAYSWNVADPEATAAGVKAIEAEHGPVDIVVNNAASPATARC
jgi:acetoacetyl-CoA reductase